LAGVDSGLRLFFKATKQQSKNSPPYKGGVAAASADGVVLSSPVIQIRENQPRENHPASQSLGTPPL
jgi:hypothetical protein